MIFSLLILLLFVNEPKLVRTRERYEERYNSRNAYRVSKAEDNKPMEKQVRKSLIFLLLSVSFWFIGYNGVNTWFTVYAEEVWGMRVGQASTCLTVATVGAIVSYIPVGIVASKIGRRKTIKFGVLILSLCFFGAFLCTLIFAKFNFILLVLFFLVGLAWASINVNSLPMVVEMCSGSKVGKFTGLYYTFSMTAQIITPVLAGWLLENISYKVLFPYAAISVAIAFITMSFVKHGDNIIVAKTGLDAFDLDD